MGEVKFDLSVITPERIISVRSKDHPVNKRSASDVIFSAEQKSGYLKPVQDKSLDVSAESLMSEALKEVFCQEFGKTFLDALNRNSQKAVVSVKNEGDANTYFIRIFKVFHVRVAGVKDSEDGSTSSYDVFWKLNNPIFYPELQAFQKEESTALEKKWQEYRQKGTFCDVTIQIDKSEFQVHRLVLAAFSPYFEVLFTGSFKERGKDRFDLTDEGFTPALFEKFLDLVYGKKVSFKDIDIHSIIALARFANKIQSTNVFKLCQNKIVGRMTEDNFKEVLFFASEVETPEIKKACGRFLMSHPEWVERIDLSTLAVAELILFKNKSSFLKDENLHKKIINEIKAKLSNANYAEATIFAKQLADAGDKDLKRHCKGYWKDHKAALSELPDAKKARLALSNIE